MAYARSWRLALALTSILPCIVIVGTVMSILMARSSTRSLGFLATGGTLAEEAIGAVRTLHAFGSQALVGRRYQEFSEKALVVEKWTAGVNGVGLGCFYFVVYAAYGLGMSRCYRSLQFY